jgi:hypothetical protein
MVQNFKAAGAKKQRPRRESETEPMTIRWLWHLEHIRSGELDRAGRLDFTVAGVSDFDSRAVSTLAFGMGISLNGTLTGQYSSGSIDYFVFQR